MRQHGIFSQMQMSIIFIYLLFKAENSYSNMCVRSTRSASQGQFRRERSGWFRKGGDQGCSFSCRASIWTNCAMRFARVSFRLEAGSRGCGDGDVPLVTCNARKTTAMTPCPHFDQIRDVKPSAKGCEDCLRVGDTWNELRVCLSCGHVGCCDDSKNQHATRHFQQTGHALIRSYDAGEHWGWCYADKLYFERMPALTRRRPWSFLARWLRG